jgi:hypothetical protein
VPSCGAKSAPLLGPDACQWAVVAGNPTDVITSEPMAPDIFQSCSCPDPGFHVSTANILGSVLLYTSEGQMVNELGSFKILWFPFVLFIRLALLKTYNLAPLVLPEELTGNRLPEKTIHLPLKPILGKSSQ